MLSQKLTISNSFSAASISSWGFPLGFFRLDFIISVWSFIFSLSSLSLACLQGIYYHVVKSYTNVIIELGIQWSESTKVVDYINECLLVERNFWLNGARWICCFNQLIKLNTKLGWHKIRKYSRWSAVTRQLTRIRVLLHIQSYLCRRSLVTHLRHAYFSSSINFSAWGERTFLILSCCSLIPFLIRSWFDNIFISSSATSYGACLPGSAKSEFHKI